MALTAKQQKFAQLIAAGANQADAYRGAYNTCNMKAATVVNNAHNLMKNSDVSAMISELSAKALEKVVEKIAIDKAWVISKLVKIVDLGMAIEVVTYGEGEEEREGELKTANLSASNKALELIGKEHGMFVDRKDIKVTAISEMSDAELDEMIIQKAKEAGVLLK